jgi:hypothetical protein
MFQRETMIMTLVPAAIILLGLILGLVGPRLLR